MKYRKINDQIEVKIDSSYHGYSIQAFFDAFHQSKKMIHELRMSNQVLVNEVPIKQNFQTQLSLGDRLQFPFFTKEAIDFIPQKMELTIAYEDDFILVIDKEPGLIIHPDQKSGLNTLVNGVGYYYQQSHQNQRVRYIHRLDQDTSGLIVLAKTAFIHSYYDFLLKDKDISRSYYAIVDGTPKKKRGFIETFIARDRHHNQKRRVASQGDFARTHYQVLQSNSKFSLVECKLDTGRTHQIRVHLAHIQHPIVGDPLYNPNKNHLIKRQALHAYKLSLIHPFTKEPITIESPLPFDMNQLLM
jgi:23S rRNA pseudouridine1911/1915/1917 synthase